MAVKIDYDSCMKCFACVGVCPHGALKEGDKGPIVDKDKCVDCGECVKTCPASCMKL